MTATMYKGFNPDRLFGGWFWSLEHVGGWDGTWSEPYEVELPDGFEIAETVSGITAVFDSADEHYELCASSKQNENCAPVIIGGRPVQRIRLRVIGKIED